jgi:hypothetical protein
VAAPRSGAGLAAADAAGRGGSDWRGSREITDSRLFDSVDCGEGSDAASLRRRVRMEPPQAVVRVLRRDCIAQFGTPVCLDQRCRVWVSDLVSA